MKKLLYVLPFVGLFWSACKNDFDVAAPWKEIPVVYAMLSPDDTAHYVRVEKAFLDEDKSAIEISKIGDSLYYPENAITVYIVRVSNADRLLLKRVDGVKEGLINDTQPRWLYKLPTNLNNKILPGEKYRVEIERADGKSKVTGETTIPKDFGFTSPIPANFPRAVSFEFENGTDFQWRSDVNGLYFNLTMKVRYREEAPDGTVLLRRTIEWTPVINVARSDIGAPNYLGKANVSQQRFFQMLADSIPPIGVDRFRYFELGDIVLEGGGYEIGEFLKIAAAANGITGAEVIPTYTNLSEGYGLVTSKNKVELDGIRITAKTVEAMRSHPLTGLLGFKL